MADIWVVLTIFVGVLGAAGLASFFIPGVSNYVATFFTTIVNLLRQAVQFVLDHSPRPLKLLLFIGLFALVGSWTYNLTYGAALVCTGPEEVSNVGYIEGIALKLLPTQDPWEDKRIVDAEIANETIAPAPTTRLRQANDSTLMYKVPGTVWFGKTYDVAYTLMPRTEPLTGLSISSFFATEDEVIWSDWFGQDTAVRYDLCLDPVTDTCVLERGYISSAPCIPSAIDAFGTLRNYPWTQPVGKVNYYLASSGDLTARFDSGTNFLTDAFAGLPGTYGPDACKVVDAAMLSDIIDGSDVDVDGETVSMSEEKRDVYGKFLNGDFGYTIVELTDSDVFFDDSYSIPLYDVSYVAVAKLETGNSTVSTAFSTYNPVTGETEDTRRCTGEDNSNCDVYQLLEGGEVVTYSNNDAFRVVCNDDTKDPFDTKPLLLGVDILNWKIMALFVVIGALFSLYAWLKDL